MESAHNCVSSASQLAGLLRRRDPPYVVIPHAISRFDISGFVAAAALIQRKEKRAGLVS